MKIETKDNFLGTTELVILGSERSGTNLLRTLVRRTLDLSGPAPPHLEKILGRSRAYQTGDVDSLGVLWLSQRLSSFVNHPKTAWGLSAEEIESSLVTLGSNLTSEIEVARATYLAMANHEGKDGYVSKPIGITDRLDELAKKIPSLQFVWIHRDPRDVMLSWFANPPRKTSLLFLVERWNREQAAFENFQRLHPVRIQTVKYANLVNRPKKEMRKIASFVKRDFKTIPAPTAQDIDESQRTDLWANLSLPVSDSLARDREASLSSIQRKAVGILARETAERLGYAVDLRWSSWPTIDLAYLVAKLSYRSPAQGQNIALINDNLAFEKRCFSDY